MQIIDQATTKEMFDLADELYETLQLKLQTVAFEVVQTKHDDLIQFVVSKYSVNLDENMTDWKLGLNFIIGSCVFKKESEAKAFLMNEVMHANLKA